MYEVIMLANAVLWLALVAVFMRQPNASIFHPLAFYLAFHFLVFVLRAPLVYYRDYNHTYAAYSFMPSIEDKSNAILATMVGLAAFAFTNLRTARSPVIFYDRANHDRQRRVMIKPFAITALLLAPIAVYSLMMSWSSGITGTTQMVTDARTGMSINTSSNGYIYEARLMLGPLCVLFAWMTRFRWYGYVPLLLFTILAAGTAKRTPLVLAFVALGLIWLYRNRRLWASPKVVVGAAALLMLFSSIGEDRGARIRSMFFQEQAAFKGGDNDLRFLEGMDYGNLEFIEYLTYIIPQRTHTYGYFLDNLQIITDPVPRVLWPGKPIGEPIKLFYIFDYGTPVGMTRSLPGEGWMGFGFVGVALWCGLFGAVWGWIYERFARGNPTNIVMMSYLVFLPLSIIFFRDGAPVSMLRYGLFLMAPFIVLKAMMVATGVDRPAAPPAETDVSDDETPAQRRARLVAQATG